MGSEPPPPPFLLQDPLSFVSIVYLINIKSRNMKQNVFCLTGFCGNCGFRIKESGSLKDQSFKAENRTWEAISIKNLRDHFLLYSLKTKQSRAEKPLTDKDTEQKQNWKT